MFTVISFFHEQDLFTAKFQIRKPKNEHHSPQIALFTTPGDPPEPVYSIGGDLRLIGTKFFIHDEFLRFSTVSGDGCHYCHYWLEKKKVHNLNAEVEYYVLFGGQNWGVKPETQHFRWFCSSDLLQRGNGGSRIYEFLHQKPGSWNIKRLLCFFYLATLHGMWILSSPTRNLST